ncbi:muconolactone Delta-isomerase [Amycolatopsis pithecellobii]|uniref:Muconolactone Delta-isomerase n=1 Tax=Amycolatopsis pithecellobii TaxID=664692 RepID=A0A6N7YP91_9PSEU|nr:muconolactone Delta-isomerase family protein [Amycolatopsis pithecellobii]MTD53698.1 muconolactone delta-isomerase [Amycolatopsis pithecellobii]
MPEYLVRIALKRPDTIDDRTWAAVLDAERAVGLDYRRRGAIQRIWRVPGTTSNVGIWSAPDVSELDQLLAGLPAFRYLTIKVEALARHYLEADQ